MKCYCYTITLDGHAVFAGYWFGPGVAEAVAFACEQGERLKIAENARGAVGGSAYEMSGVLNKFADDE